MGETVSQGRDLQGQGIRASRTDPEYAALLARAAVARALIRNGEIDPHEGLYYVIFSSKGIADAEASVNPGTITSRSYYEFCDTRPVRHGTETRYQQGCRCPDCQQAAKLAWEARTAKKREAAA